MADARFDSSTFEELLASLADNLYVFDRAHRYAFATPNAARALGLTAQQVIGHSWRELGLPASVMEPVEKQVRLVFEAGAPIREETLYGGPEGPRYYEYIIAPIRGSGEKVEFVSVLGRDVTDRKLAEARRIEVLESMGDAFFALDKDFRIVLVNRHQEAISKIPRAEAIGRIFWDVFPAARSEKLRYWSEYRRAMEHRVAVQFEEYYAPLDLWTEVRAFPTDDGGISVFFRDVTERKSAEQKLLAAREFEKRIIAIVGHDIRNPLSAIVASAQVLGRRAEADSATAKAVQRIAKGAERIRSIVDDLLDFTRANQGGIPIDLEPSNLEAICRDAVEELEPLAGGRAIEVSCEGDASGSWDPHRMGQVISNLVGNAIVHGAAHSPIVLSIRAAEDAVALEVRNGGHIAPDVLPSIFDPFKQGATEKGDHRGLGLGLFIARTIVRAHAGTIEVASSPERGTTFRVTLPRRPALQQKRLG